MRTFDAVVVGSGFGGAVSAFRLASAHQEVCVLERGRPYPPGTFARTPAQMATNVWDPSEGMFGLFNIWSFRGFDAIVSSGLGGGSLIYSNVLLRKEQNWFVQDPRPFSGSEYWPVGREELDPEYDKAEEMLGANEYPAALAKTTPRAEALKRAALALGLPWENPKLAISFGDPPSPGAPINAPNLHNSVRQTCRLVGECNIGCNFGSKNSLDLTYLSRAREEGAVIRDQCEVRSIERGLDGTWVVGYIRHDEKGRSRTKGASRPYYVRGRILVLSAGTLGTPYLLLKNRAALKGISDRLGTHFSTNGDYLGFLHSRKANFRASYGPVITTSMRMADAVDEGGTGRGFYIQDSGYPGLVDWMLEASAPFGVVSRALHLVLTRRWQELRGKAVPRDISNQVARLLGPTVRSSGILPLAGIGRDLPDGTMQIRDGILDIAWTVDTSRSYYTRLRGTLEQIGEILGATYLDNLSYRLSRAITVHPVGGCPMGRAPAEGVVSDHGEVFGCPGLFVADGSVMPGPVGVNPALTIAALAERFSGRMIETLQHHGKACV